MNINKKSLKISALITIAWVVAVGLISLLFGENAEGVARILNILTAIALTIYSVKIKTSKYKNIAPAWAVFVAIFFTGPIGVMLVVYGLLQIKQGLAELKEVKKK